MKEPPDWKEVEDYSFVEQLSYEELAWEFLKRNPKYKEAWQSYLNKTAGVRHYPLLVSLGRQWCLRELWDPDNNSPPQWTVTVKTPILTSAFNLNGDFLNLSVKEKVGLGFDLSQSIPAQINYAETLLKERQAALIAEGKLEKVKGPGKKSPDFSFYLRVLDAWLPDKTITKSMACDLMQSEGRGSEQKDLIQVVKSAKANAKLYMQGGYKKLLLKPPKP